MTTAETPESAQPQDPPWHTPLPPPPDSERLRAFGNNLVEVHAWLRSELAAIRADVENSASSAPSGNGGDPPRLGKDLRAHCLAFCEALHGHHSGEDALMFPALERDLPELAPVLVNLRREHEHVARILHDVETVLEGAATGEPGQVRDELARLATELDAHLDHEERQLVDALNDRPEAWVRELFKAAEALE